MKRTIFLALIAIATVSACAQMPKGFDDPDGMCIDDAPDDIQINGETLLYNGNKTFYVYMFDLSTMGIKESWSKLYEVLELNDWNYGPDKDESIYPSWYDQEGDLNFEDIALFCGARAGEMSMVWYVTEDWGVIWQVDDQFAQVVAIKWSD